MDIELYIERVVIYLSRIFNWNSEAHASELQINICDYQVVDPATVNLKI